MQLTDKGVEQDVVSTIQTKLLISGRRSKIKAVNTLLDEESGLLTFYDSPVNRVGDYYVHIGVPQAAQNQSKVNVDYRIAKSQDVSYKL